MHAISSINALPGLCIDISENISLVKESSIFDLDFYNQQLNVKANRLGLTEAIAHYLNIGAKNNINPHPLFDTAFYISTNKDVDFNIHNPLTHFIILGWSQNRNPHPLFDIQYYLDEYKDVYKAKINPLQHFIVFGAKEHRHPINFFNAVRYKRLAHDLALCKFFAARAAKNQNIRFSRRLRTTKIRDISLKTTYLAPYIAMGKQLGILKQLKGWRLEKISPVIKTIENPLLHFLSQGYRLGLFPFSNFELIYEICPTSGNFCRIIPRDLKNLQNVPSKFVSLAKRINTAKLSDTKIPMLQEFLESFTLRKGAASLMKNSVPILLTSHVAERNGSPMLLLNITKALVKQGYECLVLLEQGGELEKEFNDIAHTLNLNYRPDRYKKCKEYLSFLFEDLKMRKPQVCLLNSIETGHYSKAIDELGIKLITLVHEIVDSYPSSFLQDVFDRSQRVVFPAKFVQDFFHKKLNSKPSTKETIIPNALLDASFGKSNREEARKNLREEIEAQPNSLIVLACGSPDLRKGIDHFINSARIILAKRQSQSERFYKQPTHFIWVGASRKIMPWSAHYYIDWDLRQDEIHSPHIHLLAPKKELRDIFRGADIFILPSRQDPFPTVVHNAMAAELPIVTFKGAGGVPEMVSGGGAKVVPYGDILSFAQAIEDYLDDEQERLQAGKLNSSLVAERFNFNNYFIKLEKEISSLA